MISFARGAPSPDLLPAAELADCARAAIESDPAVLGYGPAGGYGPLREWIAERHGVTPGRVVLTNGSLQGFAFLAQWAIAEGRPRILVEAPTYDRPLRILAALGADVVPIPLDEEGLDPDGLERAVADGPPPAFLYTIPTFQNPSGRTLSTARRRRLVELAARHDLLVLEDDPYGLVRFEGDAPPTLLELDGGERVLYASSFSKTVAPGLRVGYFVVTEPIAAALEAAAVSTYITPVLPAQATLWEFVRRGRFEPNLGRMCGLLRERRDAMLAGLDRGRTEGTSWSRPDGGYFVWLDLPPGCDAGDLLIRAADAGVAFVKGADFFVAGRGGRTSARLAYSAVAPAAIEDGVATLLSLLPAPTAA